ncbi:ABC transporter ATP-binding protein [Cohnella sp. GCM10020058]|uniref:ABC transporter ATP-binding protein n=1 Tax=Cohnella sp. GCM10020058 TaxID=3317330 RepID=UPI00363539EC
MVAGFIILSLFVIGVELSITKFIQHLIDVLLPKGTVNSFSILLSIMSSLIALMVAATLLRNKLQRIVQEKAARDMQLSLFTHMRKLGFSYYDQHPVGETLSLFNSELTAVQQIYQKYFPGMIVTGVAFIISVALMISIHVTLSLAVIPCLLSYYIIGPFFEKRAAQLRKTVQGFRTSFQKKIYDSISALLEIRVYGSSDWDSSQTLARQRQMHNSVNKLHLMSYSRGMIRRVIVQLGAVIVFAYGSFLLRHDEISTGAMVAFMFFYFRMIQDMTSFVTLTSEQQVLMNQAERLFEFMSERPTIKDNKSPINVNIKGELLFQKVSFHYPSQSSLISNFNLEICAGEKIAFVGASGCGKSTLLKLVGRFYDPLEGEIKLDGIPLNELSLNTIREAMGFVFQETYLFGGTIRDNIRFGSPNATDEEIEAAAIAAFAHQFILDLPQQYDTIVGERGMRLSGGQRQRLSIARMFIKNPRIVLLDEATSALDNKSEFEVHLALNRLFEGRTTLAVAHRLTSIEKFDRIVVLDRQGILEQGTFDQLLKNQGPFYQLVHGRREIF